MAEKSLRVPALIAQHASKIALDAYSGTV